jgi:hypothetical protein
LPSSMTINPSNYAVNVPLLDGRLFEIVESESARTGDDTRTKASPFSISSVQIRVRASEDFV